MAACILISVPAERRNLRDLSIPFSKYGSINLSWSLLCQLSTVNLSNYFFLKESLSLNFFYSRKHIFYLALSKLTGENATVILQSAAFLLTSWSGILREPRWHLGSLRRYENVSWQSKMTAAIARCHWSVMHHPGKNARQQKMSLTRILSPWRVFHCDMRQRHAFRSTGWRPKSEKKEFIRCARQIYLNFYLINYYLIKFRVQAKRDSSWTCCSGFLVFNKVSGNYDNELFALMCDHAMIFSF